MVAVKTLAVVAVLASVNVATGSVNDLSLATLEDTALPARLSGCACVFALTTKLAGEVPALGTSTGAVEIRRRIIETRISKRCGRQTSRDQGPRAPIETPLDIVTRCAL